MYNIVILYIVIYCCFQVSGMVKGSLNFFYATCCVTLPLIGEQLPVVNRQDSVSHFKIHDLGGGTNYALLDSNWPGNS